MFAESFHIQGCCLAVTGAPYYCYYYKKKLQENHERAVAVLLMKHCTLMQQDCSNNTALPRKRTTLYGASVAPAWQTECTIDACSPSNECAYRFKNDVDSVEL